MGSRHVPIKYAYAVSTLVNTLENYGQNVGQTDLVITGKNQDALVGMFELNGLHGEGNDQAIAQFAFRMSEMQKTSFKAWMGEKMMVCTNLVVLGGQKLVQHMHTAGLRLKEMLAWGVERILALKGRFDKISNKLKGTYLSKSDASYCIIDMMRKNILPSSKIRTVTESYWEPKGAPEIAENRDNAYGLYQAVTRAFRNMSPEPLIERTAALGNYWGF
jgi:hypothetical protein